MTLNYRYNNIIQNSKSVTAERHGFHIVKPSPWPFLTSINLLLITELVLCIFDNLIISYFGFLLA